MAEETITQSDKKIRSILQKNEDKTYTEYPIGAKAKNVKMENGNDLEKELTLIENSIVWEPIVKK